MTELSIRQLTPSEEAFIVDELRRLREHYRVWPTEEGCEHHLVAFAYYEGHARRDACCRKLLAETAAFALGQELTARHGFHWIIIDSGEAPQYGVAHPALRKPIDLFCLEDGSWNDEEYDLGNEPEPGRRTHDSLDTILERVRALSSGAT